MRTLLVATAAFAALVIVAPVGHADGLSDLNVAYRSQRKPHMPIASRKAIPIFGVNWNIRDDHPNGYALAKKDAGLSDADAIQAASPAMRLRNFCK